MACEVWKPKEDIHGSSSKRRMKRSQSRFLELVETSATRVHSPYFLDYITEAQRGELMAPRSPGKSVVEPELEVKSLTLISCPCHVIL